jgi:hypothetical protein
MHGAAQALPLWCGHGIGGTQLWWSPRHSSGSKCGGKFCWNGREGEGLKKNHEMAR